MNILAVADKESSTLLHWVEKGEAHLRLLDLIVSCGDLPASYLEYLSNALGVDLVYVRGNHDAYGKFNGAKPHPETLCQVPCYEEKFDGLRNIHGHIFPLKECVFAGFEGSLWYNGEGPQYHEEEMFQLVRNMELRLRLHRLRDWFRRTLTSSVIVSHAPPAGVHDGQDLCHKGFLCYHHLLKAFLPVLWIHGHTATESVTKNQVSFCGQTTILNCYEHKFIHLEQGKAPEISYLPTVLQGSLAI